MSGDGMLDQLLDFANGVNSSEVTIRISENGNGKQILVSALGAKRPVLYEEKVLMESRGGVLNDWHLQKALNDQLANTGGRGSKTAG
jgi:hypothetical protein